MIDVPRETKDGVAWVTGASSGIGRTAAIELAERGYKVAVTARRTDELAALAAAFANIFSFPGDVADRSQMAAVAGDIAAAHGPIALAFLNAGIYFPAEAERFSAELTWRTFEVNVGGVVNCLDPLLEAMRARGRGQIAINASLAGYGGIPGSPPWGDEGRADLYGRSAEAPYAPKGLTVQIINPGFVGTEMTAHNTHFEMPFLMDAERAARIICDGFRAGRLRNHVPAAPRVVR